MPDPTSVSASEREGRPATGIKAALALIAAVEGELAALRRADLRGRLVAAAARIKRPNPVLCVVGEFKQGKSSLVNALLGEAICPVDDDLATSTLTLIYHAPTPIAHLRRSRDGKAVVEEVAIAVLPDLVTERGDPASETGSSASTSGFPAPSSSAVSSSSTHPGRVAFAAVTPRPRSRSSATSTGSSSSPMPVPSCPDPSSTSCARRSSGVPSSSVP